MRKIALAAACSVLTTLACHSALAWTRAGHMVTAAIAYDELEANDPVVVDRIIEILSHHPERGPFEVAIARTTGVERTKRIFLETARWPDDIRGGAYDHPTWHAAFRPVIDPQDPPPKLPPNTVNYEAFEALPLNVHMAADALAPESDRAVALCWVFHIVGDIHQPLHAATLYSRVFPDGDHAGALEFVLDPRTHQPINLHWFWDDRVSQSDEPDDAFARAHELERKYPRAHFAEELAKTDGIVAWADESYAAAKAIAYAPSRPRAISAVDAKPPDDAYVKASTNIAEQRLTLAGYRLADLLRKIFAQP
jgi:S1/P1 Nuclease